MPDDQVLIDVDGVCVHYGNRLNRKQILFDATFDVKRGESIGVIGETGSGKSTLARAIVGLAPLSAGTISVDSQEVSSFSARQWRNFRKRGVAQYVFQDPLRSLDPDITIGESLAEPLLLQGRLNREEIRERIEAGLTEVRLDTDLSGRFPGELSGGQRQRVLVARALVTHPDVLLLDEPVSALDSANRVQVLEILNGLREAGRTLLFISHDLGSVAGVTDRVLVLYQGRVVEFGPTADIVNRPRHPYTRLLVGSAPTLRTGSIDKARRDELRQLLEAH